MADRLVAVGPVPGRPEPDVNRPPTVRIEGGTELVELERRNGWVRVVTPDAQAVWVDRRRLAPLVDSSGAPAPDQPSFVPPVAGWQPSPSAGAGRPRRSGALWVTLATIAVVVVVAAGVILLAGGDDEIGSRSVPDPPVALRGALELPVSAIGVRPEGRDAALVLTEAGILRLLSPVQTAPADVLTVSAVLSDPAEGLQPEAAASAGLEGVVVLDGDDRLVTHAAFSLDVIEATELDVEVEPLIECVRRWDDEAVVVVFPRADDGLTDRLLLYGAESLDPLHEYVLPEPVSVTATTEFLGDLYVGHTRGLLGLHIETDPVIEVTPIFRATTPTAALTDAFTVDDDLILALDAEGESIAVFRSGAELSHTVDLVAATGASRTYDRTLAAVGPYAYVITLEGDLFVVDIRHPDQLPDPDRLLRSLGGLGFANGRPRLMSLGFDWGGRNGGVLVAEPGTNRVWWVAPDVEHDPNARIPVTTEGS